MQVRNWLQQNKVYFEVVDAILIGGASLRRHVNDLDREFLSGSDVAVQSQ